ncbi:MAG: hypothetical protein Q9227_009119 [Pyrenula ochraceoflavens]
MGWLYRCTQDHNGFLPASLFSDDFQHDHPDVSPSQDPVLNQLSPWMEQAIERGHYTEKQEAVLKEQKLGVKASIIAMEANDIQARGMTRFYQRQSLPIRSFEGGPAPLSSRLSLGYTKPTLGTHKSDNGEGGFQNAYGPFVFQDVGKESRGKEALVNQVGRESEDVLPHSPSSSTQKIEDNGKVSEQDFDPFRYYLSVQSVPDQPNSGIENPINNTDAPQNKSGQFLNGSTLERSSPLSTKVTQGGWPQSNRVSQTTYKSDLGPIFSPASSENNGHILSSNVAMLDSPSTNERSSRADESLMSRLHNTNVTIPIKSQAQHVAKSAERDEICAFPDCQPYNSLQSPCMFAVCPSCRASFRDRTYLSLGQTLAEGLSKMPSVPEWELSNRPISPAETVRKLGQSNANYKGGIMDEYSPVSPSTDLVGSSASSRDEKLGEVRHALHSTRHFFNQIPVKIMNIVGGQSKSGSRASSSRSSRLSTATDRHKLKDFVSLKRTKAKEAREEQFAEENKGAGLDEVAEAMYYYQGINTPLPDVESDEYTDSSSEVEVEGGVALTEEGVTLNTADITMQA